MNAPRPYYDLRAVRGAILSGRAFIAHRPKNLEMLGALGFSDSDALAEIVSLRLDDFKGIHCWNCGKEMTCGRGAYEYENKYLGHLSVPKRRLNALVEMIKGLVPLRSAAMFAF